MQISVIIPMYNEEAVIAETAQTLSAYMQQTFSSYEILFSDDGSTDQSASVVQRLELPYTRVIRASKNYGKGHAVRTAVLEAKGDLVLFTDADLAYGTEVIGQFFSAFSQGLQKGSASSVLLGSRNLTKNGYGQYTAIRRRMSKCYLRLLCLFGGFRLSDSQCGCKAFQADAAKAIFQRCTVDGFAFDFEVILWAQRLQYSVCELPVQILKHGNSNVSILRDSWKMLSDLRKIRKYIKNSAKNG